MERTASPRYQPCAENLVPSAVDLPQTLAPRPFPLQSYQSGGSSSSEDELSDSEFGENYSISKPKPLHECSYPNYHDRVRRFQGTFDRHEPGSPPPYRKQPRRYHSSLSTAHSGFSGTISSAREAHLSSRNTFRIDRSDDALGLEIHASSIARLSCEVSTAKPMSSPKTSAPYADTTKESNTLSEAIPHAPTSPRVPRYEQPSAADDLQRETTLERLTASSDKGPIVNHYPQPERLYDVEFAIVTANKAFDLSNVSGTSESFLESVERVSTAFAIDSIKPCKGQSRIVNTLPTGAQDLVYGEGHRTTPGYFDGNGGRGSHGGNGYASFYGSHGNPSSTPQQGPSGSRDGDGSGPYDDEDPQNTPATHASLEPEEDKRFPCVFHHPDNPQNDCTLECKTLQEYISQLRVHHSGNNHRFYYCINCFEKFASEEERKTHGKGCKNNKCVTEDCPNFERFHTATCNHPGKGRQNSQWSKWKALFRLARPGEAIPNLDAFAAHPSRSTATNITTPASVGRQGQSSIVSISDSRQNHFSSPQVSGVAPMTPATVSPSTCERQLETFVSSLLHQLDSPESEGLEMLRDMHFAYMDHDFDTLVRHCQSPGEARTIRGLFSLSNRLWAVVQTSDGVSPDYIQKLRGWAYGILPQHRASFASPVTSPPTHQIPHELQSPTLAVAARSKDKHRQAHITAAQDYNFDSQDVDDTTSGALMLGNPPTFDFELFDQRAGPAPPTYVDPGQLHRSSCPPGPASYLPFTQRDSAAALHSQRHAHGKQSNTDSGYGTGGFGNGFGT